MTTLHLGYDALRRPIRLDPDDRKTHMHVIGSSGSGKSKFLEWMIRGDLRNRQGFCLLDPHGRLYNDVVKYCAHRVLNRDIILLNLSAGERIVGFNPFQKASDTSVAIQVASRIAATMHAWNMENTDQTPTLERTLRLIYTVMLDRNLALPQMQHLIDFNAHQIRKHLIDNLQTPLIQKEWRELQQLRPKEWRDEILSAKNRLFRFLTSPALMRCMGLSDRTLDLQAIMDEGKVLLVNLAVSDQLSDEDARVFGALLVNEFFECARRRPEKDSRGRAPKPYYLYIDEFQEFVSIDVSKALDQARKFGLFAVLSHQRFGQLNDDLIDSLSNCKIKAVFGGLPVKWARYMAEEMFINKLDPMKIKAAIYQTKFWPKYGRDKVYTHGTSHGTSSSRSSTTGGGEASSASTSAAESQAYFYDDWFSLPQLAGTRTETTSRGHADMSGRSSSWAESTADTDSSSESESVADVPIFIPVPFQELSSVQYYSLEEQLMEMTAALKEQFPRHCFIKIQTEDAEPMLVPKVEQSYTSAKNIERYEDKLLTATNALPVAEVDRLIAAQETALLQLAAPSDVIDLEPQSAESEGLQQPYPKPKPARKKPPDAPLWNRQQPPE
jgi:hypothetical protein